MASKAPIALFVYNRPEHTRLTLEGLAANKQAQESDLYIYSDGAKSGAEDQVAMVRDLVSAITGFKSVSVIERPHNMGLSANITDGVTFLCNKFDTVIVLEDDLVTSPQFLEYMNAGLAQYANDKIVMQISGHSFLEPDGTNDCVMLPISTSWGWATWKRAWKYYEADASFGYKALCHSRELRKRFDAGDYPYFNLLKAHINGQNDSWAIRWYLSIFTKDGLVLYPPATLVDNKGFDGSGTHCRDVGLGAKIIIFSPIKLENLPPPSLTPDGVDRFKIGLSKSTMQPNIPPFALRIKHMLKMILVKFGVMGK